MKKLIILILMITVLGCGRKEPELCAWEKDGVMAVYDSANEEWYTGEYKEFYDNGNIYSKATYKNGIMEGEEVSYTVRGDIISKAFYKNGKLEGERITYNEDGKVWTKENYKDGELDGEALEYFLVEERLAVKSSYKNGILDGQQLEYFIDGKIKKENYYKNGLKDGREVINKEFNLAHVLNYYEKGKLKERQIIDESQGINVKEKYEKTKFGEKTTGYNSQEIKIYEAEFKDGKLNGKYIKYCDDGHVKLTANYFDGFLEGEEVVYSCDGIILAKSMYRSGRLKKKEEFHNNGQAMYKARYTDGLIDGVVEGYDEDGNLDYKLNFVNGWAEGDFVFYGMDGVILGSLEYKENKKIKGKIPEGYEKVVDFFMSQTIKKEEVKENEEIVN